MTDNGWGATFHRHTFNNEIHRDGGPECTQKGTPRTVYVFDPDYLAAHDLGVAKAEREEWAQFFERRGSTVGGSPLTDEMVADFLRGPRPWGVSEEEQA